MMTEYPYTSLEYTSYGKIGQMPIVWHAGIWWFYGMHDKEELGLGTGDPPVSTYLSPLLFFPLLPRSSSEEAIMIHIFLRLLYAPMALSGVLRLRC